jgi:hypothetical protein
MSRPLHSRRACREGNPERLAASGSRGSQNNRRPRIKNTRSGEFLTARQVRCEGASPMRLLHRETMLEASPMHGLLRLTHLFIQDIEHPKEHRSFDLVLVGPTDRH